MSSFRSPIRIDALAGIVSSGPDSFPEETLQRSKFKTNSADVFTVPLDQRWRVHDAPGTVLPNTAAADDLGLIVGAFGTVTPTLQTSDAKATTVTQYARTLLTLPAEYVADASVSIRIYAGMLTTVSDGTATVDVQAYEFSKAGGVGSDLVTTAAQDINSLTASEKTFVLTDTGLVAGDQLDVRIAISITDSATATVVKGIIGEVALLCDTK